VLKLLSKAALIENERIIQKSSFKISRSQSFDHGEFVPAEHYLAELLDITRSIKHEISEPLQTFVGHVEVEGTPRYHPEKDSVSLQLGFRYLLSEDLSIERTVVKISPAAGDIHREVHLESEGPVDFKKGITKLLVQTNVSKYTIYPLDA
jgi:hypothetical protein